MQGAESISEQFFFTFILNLLLYTTINSDIVIFHKTKDDKERMASRFVLNLVKGCRLLSHKWYILRNDIILKEL